MGAFTEQNYKIESNSQHYWHLLCYSVWCFYWTKLQNWKQFTTQYDKDYVTLGVLLLNKITKLKAIHNNRPGDSLVYQGAFTEQNYKIESNSQRHSGWKVVWTRCFYWTKLQNWKQFTTIPDS